MLQFKLETIVELSRKYGINAEYASAAFYPVFREGLAGARVLVLSDGNTRRYADPFAAQLADRGIAADSFVLPSREPVADEAACAAVEERAKEGYGYVLAVGAGTPQRHCEVRHPSVWGCPAACSRPPRAWTATPRA